MIPRVTGVKMAGHSKWANIKHKKAKEDASRGKAFTKLSKDITVCAKEAGDVHTNPRLRTLVEKARHLNMPLDNIKRAIQKGTGELQGVAYEQHVYEGYGPSATAVIVEMLTENKNRAIAELRHVFSRKGGTIGENGCVNWMFNKKGVVKATGTLSEDQMLEALLDYDIDDISKDEDFCSIICAIKDLEHVKQKVTASGMKVESAEIEWVAKDKIAIAPEDEEKVMDFLSAIDELDDVQNVYSNAG